MRTNSKRRTAFSNVMKHMQTRPGFGSSVTHILSSFDWASVHKVVDIGGGLGDTCKQIIEHASTLGNSTLHCVVQDLPDVIAEVQSQELDKKYGERLSFMGHDFFQEQPVKDADVYLLRWVLHDWSDANATKILNRLVSALKPGANVIIHEFVVPPSGSVPFYYEKTIR
jgi:ubiquinone/menaquinone biosynthesis C-methylase UbiE